MTYFALIRVHGHIKLLNCMVISNIQTTKFKIGSTGYHVISDIFSECSVRHACNIYLKVFVFIAPIQPVSLACSFTHTVSNEFWLDYNAWPYHALNNEI